MRKWFRLKRMGFGFSPYSIEGWLLTGGLLVGLYFLKQAFRHDHEPLPTLFYVLAIAAIAAYAGIAYVTTDREQ